MPVYYRNVWRQHRAYAKDRVNGMVGKGARGVEATDTHRWSKIERIVAVDTTSAGSKDIVRKGVGGEMILLAHSNSGHKEQWHGQ
jgi:hypothetical protein